MQVGVVVVRSNVRAVSKMLRLHGSQKAKGRGVSRNGRIVQETVGGVVTQRNVSKSTVITINVGRSNLMFTCNDYVKVF